MVSTSIGGMFRDHCAKWISEFTMQTREELMFKIEVKTILEDLKIARDSEFRQLKVECDNALVVETNPTGGVANSRMSELRLIYQLLDCDWRVCFQYIPRDHNKIVDHMAPNFTEIPVSIGNLLESNIDHSTTITS